MTVFLPISLPDRDFVQLRQHAALSRGMELLEIGRFYTPVLQPGINSPNIYTAYQMLLLLERIIIGSDRRTKQGIRRKNC